ncbi:MAG: ROK family protein [Firmicutes bacterium]|nr:ROK family protein [Bacillota bacterium]MBR7149296.1 ROK family protein [Bacillota bacterium]
MIHVGFDIGGTNIKAGLVNDQGQIQVKRNVPFPKESVQACVDTLDNLIKDMLNELNLTVTDIADIGIAVPGSIDPSWSIVVNAYNLGFHDVPLKAMVSERYPGIPVALANDANAAALAELYGGAFDGKKTAILLTLGTGVGGGIILNGKMFNGGRGNGVEIGHMTLVHNGPQCTCGNKGCFETVCAATALVKAGKKAFEEDPHGGIAKRAGGKIERVNAKTVVDCAKNGDPVAVKIFDEYIDCLAQGIASLADILDPEVVALGGGVSLAGDFLYEPLRKLVKEKNFFKVEYDVVPAVMGNDAGTIGAAMLVSNAQ